MVFLFFFFLFFSIHIKFFYQTPLHQTDETLLHALRVYFGSAVKNFAAWNVPLAALTDGGAGEAHGSGLYKRFVAPLDLNESALCAALGEERRRTLGRDALLNIFAEMAGTRRDVVDALVAATAPLAEVVTKSLHLLEQPVQAIYDINAEDSDLSTVVVRLPGRAPRRVAPEPAAEPARAPVVDQGVGFIYLFIFIYFLLLYFSLHAPLIPIRRSGISTHDVAGQVPHSRLPGRLANTTVVELVKRVQADATVLRDPSYLPLMISPDVKEKQLRYFLGAIVSPKNISRCLKLVNFESFKTAPKQKPTVDQLALNEQGRRDCYVTILEFLANGKPWCW